LLMLKSYEKELVSDTELLELMLTPRLQKVKVDRTLDKLFVELAKKIKKSENKA